MKTWRIRLASIAVLALAVPAYATFHVMQIEQVIGGVNGDATAQAIQLRMRSLGQNLVSNGRLVAYDSAGLNPVVIIAMTTNVANALAGDRVLVVSTNFANYTSPVLASDFVMTNLIPTNYLSAGRLTWEDNFSTILWSLSWGGANYTGSNAGSIINDANGNFGPSFPGSLPTTTLQSLLFTNSASALSLSNIVDYAVTIGSAVFTNNARQGFLTVPAPAASGVALEGNNVRITWSAAGGRSYIVQVTSGSGGSFSTNAFTNLSGTITIPGTGNAVTNFLDIGGATNTTARYYRVRLVP